MATLGIDIGCISVKMALVGGEEDGELFASLQEENDLFATGETAGLVVPDGETPPLLITRYRRIKGTPAETTRRLLEEITAAVPPGLIQGVRATGSGAGLVAELLDATFENEFKALARAVGSLYEEVSTVFEMGGETSKFIRLDRDPDDGTVGIVDYQANGDCAAGTGSFMDQQASRLRYSIEDVGDVVLSAGKAASIAGRCSVFAKSDMIHAQQKGYQPPEVLKGLCSAVVRNYKGTITKGKKIGDKVAFIGGMAANKGAVDAVRTAFDLSPEDLLIPQHYVWMGAIGAAMIEADERAGTPSRVVDLTNLDPETSPALPTTTPLSMDRVILLRDRKKPYTLPDQGMVEAYLGIDVGSVSTNLVVLDHAGGVIKSVYLKTDGRPVEVVNTGLAEIWEEVGPRLDIRGVGTTGSGRELIGELSGADTINDEITAHKTGATLVGGGLIDRPPDTIFEIGGQDSKFISLDNGVVVDFAMNEACAAGTGSFLEEQAEKMDINIIDGFAELALSSQEPIRLGERCTVFMERDVNSYLQRGASARDLVAGLAYSIVHNYLNRLVGSRPIGDTIYFQGGTAYNDSVAAAFSEILGKDIIVPPHNGVIGAIGMAVLARDKVEATGEPSKFRGWDLDKINYKIREFTCKGCTNQCDIRQFTVGKEKTYWGDKCSDRYRKRAKVDSEPVIPDLPALREELVFSYVTGKDLTGRREAGDTPGSSALDTAGPVGTETGSSRGVVGLPRAMYTYDRLPFWSTFMRECGFDVLVSRETEREVRAAGVDSSVSEPCFPIRAAHGHVVDLLDRGVDYVLVPNLLNEETDHPDIESHACPWGQTLPWVLRANPALEKEAERILAPTLHFRRGPEAVKEALRTLMKPLGVRRRAVDRAVEAAYAAQGEFRKSLLEAGADALATLAEHEELGIVLVGRPYNIYDPGVNMDIPAKLRKYYAVNVIPMDFLPLWDTETRDINPNMYWNWGRRILQTARFVEQYPNLHVIYMSNFKCGPDSYIKHSVRGALSEPFLSLQFDEHTNDAGAMTRCEAYLDSKGFLRWWARDRGLVDQRV